MTATALARAYTLLWAITLAAAAAATLLHPLAAATRAVLHLKLAPHPANASYLLSTAASNMLAGGWPALLAFLRVPLGGRRLAAGVWLAVNVAPVGLAIGAYGSRLAGYLVHLPLEWAALALALTAALARAPRSRRACVRGAGAFLLLLVAAAAAETYLTPHR